MNLLMEKDIIREIPCGANLSYVIAEESFLLPTEYKVLQSNENNSLARCMRLLYNGKPQLYYQVQDYKAFSLLLPMISVNNFWNIVINLLTAIIDVKNNGFLKCLNLDISFDKVFIEPNTWKVKLIYIPVCEGIFNDYFAFSNELRTSLIKVINDSTNLQSVQLAKFASELLDDTYDLEELLKRMQKYAMQDTSIELQNNSVMRLVEINGSASVEMVIEKEEFVIGTDETVDGRITDNPAISSIHCKVVKTEKKYTIVDLGSRSGTYVKQLRLPSYQACEIKNGDVIRLANSEFRVEIR